MIRIIAPNFSMVQIIKYKYFNDSNHFAQNFTIRIGSDSDSIHRSFFRKLLIIITHHGGGLGLLSFRAF